MKKIIIILVINLFIPYLILASNKNIAFSIKNKIFEYLHSKYDIERIDINYNDINTLNIPDYNLYNIEIMNFDKIKLKKNIIFKIKISNFFNNTDYSMININVLLSKIKNFLNKNFNVNINQSIKIFYKNKNIRFYDRGSVKKKLYSDIIMVKNSFGHLLKCRLISDKLAEVIE